MHEYEFRILKADGSAGVITQEVHLNANAAINKASRLAGERRFEVWCDDRCIYAGHRPAPPSPTPPNHPAA